jgi:hypothetical protein
MIRTYSELRRLETLEARYAYLRLNGVVGKPTFGNERYINQNFYRSKQWEQIRHHIIVRDNGCDLGIDGYDIHNRLLIHHMNPMEAIDITSGSTHVLDPEFLITTTLLTHNAIHYGDERLLPREFIPRSAGDTKLW